MFLALNNAVQFQDTAGYFTVVANYSGLPRTAQLYRDIEHAEDAMVASSMRTAEYWKIEATPSKESAEDFCGQEGSETQGVASYFRRVSAEARMERMAIRS